MNLGKKEITNELKKIRKLIKCYLIEMEKLNSQRKRISQKSRAEDARKKIELGGLVIKSGLGEEDKNIILGILMEGIENLHSENNLSFKKRYKEKGDIKFKLDQELKSQKAYNS